jgi:hypothetical protein
MKYKSLKILKDQIKLKVNNAYLHPQKFKFDQIDSLLYETESLHKQALKFEDSYTRFLSDFSKIYADLQSTIEENEKPGFIIRIKTKLNKPR